VIFRDNDGIDHSAQKEHLTTKLFFSLRISPVCEKEDMEKVLSKATKQQKRTRTTKQ
jgi:hypothetical protein